MAYIDTTKLIQLASERTVTAKTQLTNAIIDLFLPADQRLTEQQRALMGDVLGKLVTSIESDVRVHLAEAIMNAGVGLPDLERLLANDEIEIARPVLEASHVLHDRDLIEIVINRSDEHRLSIALRDHVSSDVSEVIVDHGSPDVIEALLRNENAVISRRAMEYLVSESKRYDRFQEPLLNRNDLPIELVHRLYWSVSAALKRHILRNFSVNEVQLDKCVQDAARRAMAEYETGQNAQARAMRLARQLHDDGELNDNFLLRTLRQRRLNLFVACIAERGSMNFLTAWKIIYDTGYESFIVLAKAIEMSRDITTSIVLLLSDVNAPKSPKNTMVLGAIVGLFDELDHHHAERVLALWQRDIGYQFALDALAEVHQ